MNKGLKVDARTVLGHLEALAEQIGIEVRYEAMEGEESFSTGGMCRIRGRPVIIINSRAPREDRIRTFVNALRRLDLSQIYLLPGIRDLIENQTQKENEM